MKAVRTVERMVSGHGFRMARMVGFQIGLPYDDPAYYPVYAKCAELGIPLGLNVGIPAPLIPGPSSTRCHWTGSARSFRS
jgi:predicted TIM-barrel fold metal-dependent hydrolase